MKRNFTPLIAWESQCRLPGYMHRYQIVAELPQGVLEKCSLCHNRLFIKVLDGRIDNVAYIRSHNRQCLPPNHPRYQKEYAK